MKLQLNVFLKIFNKNKLWFLIFLLIIILNIVLLMVMPPQVEITTNHFLPLVGYPIDNAYNFTAILIIIYQFVLLSYIIIAFLNHDFEYSFENIILRASSKKWIAEKITISFLFILVFKTLQILITYIYFINKIPFKFDYLTYPFFYSLLITSFLLFNVNFSKKSSFLLYILEIIILIYFLQNFNMLLAFLISLFLTVFTYFQFNFKRNC